MNYPTQETGTFRRYLIDVTSGALVALAFPASADEIITYGLGLAAHPVASTSLNSDYLSVVPNIPLQDLYQMNSKEEDVMVKVLLKSAKIIE